MTPNTLEQAGVALYGPRWQTDLARALGVADRTMRRWANGVNPIPAGIAEELLHLVRARQVELKSVEQWLAEHAGSLESGNNARSRPT